ncbi:MAG: ABC transporter ATP-binding protein [Betaproteobacteria bacterium]|nr:ABC transporter ATP-binding protein [Betaproteobacteria bacterium]
MTRAVRGRPRIVFEDVSVEFPVEDGRLSVVDRVSLSICEEEFICIVGPSGCGKTTLMNVAAGFEHPCSGRVTLDGKPIEGPGRNRGVIFQEYGVFPWLNVRDNILFGMRLRSSRVPASEQEAICQKYLDLMGLKDFANAFPKTLSGGMRQRLAIARAYAAQPEFLLMDEPFGALDAQTRSKMQNLLLDVLQREGKTVLMITHSVDEAIYLASRIVVVTARPARIKKIIEVPFAYPRREGLQETPEFGALKAYVRDLVMAEYEVQQQLGSASAGPA